MAIKFLTLTNFKMYQKQTTNRDYDWSLTFIPTSPDEKELGTFTMTVDLPHIFGVVDNTVNDTDFICTLIFEDSDKKNYGSATAKFAFFTRKNYSVPSTTQEPQETLDSLEIPQSDTIRSIKGPTGNTYINLFDDKIEIVGGKEKIVISSDGISHHTNTSEANMPSTSRGVFQDKNIFSLIPNFFVTPFPNTLPDMKLITKIQNILNAASTMSEIINLIKQL